MQPLQTWPSHSVHSYLHLSPTPAVLSGGRLGTQMYGKSRDMSGGLAWGLAGIATGIQWVDTGMLLKILQFWGSPPQRLFCPILHCSEHPILRYSLIPNSPIHYSNTLPLTYTFDLLYLACLAAPANPSCSKPFLTSPGHSNILPSEHLAKISRQHPGIMPAASPSQGHLVAPLLAHTVRFQISAL